MSRIYHCVYTTIDESGVIGCSMGEPVQANSKPDQFVAFYGFFDTYIDYFETEEEACAFVAQTLGNEVK